MDEFDARNSLITMFWALQGGKLTIKMNNNKVCFVTPRDFNLIVIILNINLQNSIGTSIPYS